MSLLIVPCPKTTLLPLISSSTSDLEGVTFLADESMCLNNSFQEV